MKLSIEYREDATGLTEDNLVMLWKSVGWDTGSVQYPDRLLKALQNSDFLVVAWDGDTLVGVLEALDDSYGVFVNYLCVRPYYQGLRIGSKLMEMLLARYSGLQVWLMTQNASGFYRRFGFVSKLIAMENEDMTPYIPAEGNPLGSGLCIRADASGITEGNLKGLWQSVGWVDDCVDFDNRLYGSVVGSDYVAAVWDGNTLVGVVTTMDDTFNVYVSLLVVRPEYQGRGIGMALVGKVFSHYPGYRFYLVTRNASGFYRKAGFNRGEMSMLRDFDSPVSGS